MFLVIMLYTLLLENVHKTTIDSKVYVCMYAYRIYPNFVNKVQAKLTEQLENNNNYVSNTLYAFIILYLKKIFLK